MAVAGFGPGIDRWYYTSRLGPSYWFALWFNAFDDVIDVGGHLGLLKVFFNVNVHFGQLPFLLIILTPFC